MMISILPRLPMKVTKRMKNNPTPSLVGDVEHGVRPYHLIAEP